MDSLNQVPASQRADDCSGTLCHLEGRRTTIHPALAATNILGGDSASAHHSMSRRVAAELFSAIGANNSATVQRLAHLLRGGEGEGGLGEATCDWPFKAFGIKATGRTAAGFAEALVAAGHDRVGILRMLRPPPGSSSAAGSGLLLQPGDRCWHEEMGLLIVALDEGGDAVRVRQFERNGREAAVRRSALLPVPPAPAAWWLHPRTSFSLYSAGQEGLARFPLHVEAALEEAYSRGAARLEYTMRFEYSGEPEGCVADFADMTERNLERGFLRMIRRVPKPAPAGTSPQPLSVVELEEIVRCGGGRAQVREKGGCAVLFMMEDNVKARPCASGPAPARAHPPWPQVKLDATGKTTFVPLRDLFGPDEDLEADAQQRAHTFNPEAIARVGLPPAATERLPAAAAPYTAALTPQSAEAFVGASVERQWQFLAGTRWAAFPGSVCRTLSSTLDLARLRSPPSVLLFRHLSDGAAIVLQPDGKAEGPHVIPVDELGAGHCRLSGLVRALLVAPAAPDAAELLGAAAELGSRLGTLGLDVAPPVLEAEATPPPSDAIVFRISNEVLTLCGHDPELGLDLAASPIGRAFAIAAPAGQSGLVISSPTVEGLARGCSAVLQAAGEHTSQGCVMCAARRSLAPRALTPRRAGPPCTWRMCRSRMASTAGWPSPPRPRRSRCSSFSNSRPSARGACPPPPGPYAWRSGTARTGRAPRSRRTRLGMAASCTIAPTASSHWPRCATVAARSSTEHRLPAQKSAAPPCRRIRSSRAASAKSSSRPSPAPWASTGVEPPTPKSCRAGRPRCSS